MEDLKHDRFENNRLGNGRFGMAVLGKTIFGPTICGNTVMKMVSLGTKVPKTTVLKMFQYGGF